MTADGKLVEQSDSARYRQIGNGMAVDVVLYIAERIKEYVDGKR